MLTLPSITAAHLEREHKLTPQAMAQVIAYTRGEYATDLLKGLTAEQIGRIVGQQAIPRPFTPDAVCDLVQLLLDPGSRSLTGQVLHVGGV